MLPGLVLKVHGKAPAVSDERVGATVTPEGDADTSAGTSFGGRERGPDGWRSGADTRACHVSRACEQRRVPSSSSLRLGRVPLRAQGSV